MAIYAIGDIQGCYQPFKTLLAKAQFDPQQDELWVAGDLVNRGPDNVSVLRHIKGLGDRAKVVLGNHDLHLLAMRAGHKKLSKKDTVQDVMDSPDADALMDWLQRQPLMYKHEKYVLTHAGMPHIWSIEQAQALADEVHAALIGADAEAFFADMYGNTPPGWRNNLQGLDRLRVITNYFTRMRFLADDGTMDFEVKENADSAPPGMKPWFDYIRSTDTDSTFLFGHWAAIDGQTTQSNCIALDTGCVWGGCLTMMRLEDKAIFQVECA